MESPKTLLEAVRYFSDPEESGLSGIDRPVVFPRVSVVVRGHVVPRVSGQERRACGKVRTAAGWMAEALSQNLASVNRASARRAGLSVDLRVSLHGSSHHGRSDARDRTYVCALRIGGTVIPLGAHQAAQNSLAATQRGARAFRA